MRTRDVLTGALCLASIAVLGAGQSFVERAGVLQAQTGVEAPMFEVDPLWPQPLPNHWVMGMTIGVAVDAEGAEVVKPYAKENGIEYQIVIGDEGLARKFGAPGFPALAVVSPDGKIDSMHVGLIEEADLDVAIAEGQGS